MLFSSTLRASVSLMLLLLARGSEARTITKIDAELPGGTPNTTLAVAFGDVVPTAPSVDRAGGHRAAAPVSATEDAVMQDGERRLAALRAKLPALDRRIAARRASGEDVSYPMVTYTVLANFVRYVDEDLAGLPGKAKPEIERAMTQLSELETMAARLDRDLKQRRRFPVVPRWTGSQRPRIVGPAFLAPTVAGGRMETRPVFFTGYGHFGQVVDDIEKLPGYGANIIQIEVGPSSLFPTPNSVNRSAIRNVQAVLRRAQKAGVGVCLLISPHYMPDWMLNRYPALRKHREGFLQYCLHAPEGQALLRRFIRVLIPAVKDSPALHSICISNEPVNVEEPCEPGKALWRAWLRRHHADIGVLNSRWGTNYAGFENIPMPDPFGPEVPDRIRVDYNRWNQEFFAGWHRMLADEVHRYAPGLPVHSKPMSFTFLYAQRDGVDAGLFGSFSQINGNDAVNIASPGGEFAQGWANSAMTHDLQRSVLDAPVFDSENHLIPDRFTGYVSPDHIRAAIWQADVHGQSATTIWVWERNFDHKSDFYGSIMHRPACAEAVGVVNCDLNRAANEVTALQCAVPDAWIVESVSARTSDGMRYIDCLSKLYTALDLSGRKVGFVTERQLEAGLSLAGRSVYVPNITCLSDKAFRSLRTAGSLYLVGGGDLLSRDQYGQPRKERLKGTPVPFTYSSTTPRELWTWILANHPGPAKSLHVVSDTNPREAAWGVEWRIAPCGSRRVLNICNYRSESMAVRIVGADGKQVAGLRDVLTAERVGGRRLVLKPLEFRLLVGSW